MFPTFRMPPKKFCRKDCPIPMAQLTQAARRWNSTATNKPLQARKKSKYSIAKGRSWCWQAVWIIWPGCFQYCVKNGTML